MSRSKAVSGGPSFSDIHTGLMYLMGNYPVHASIHLTPLPGQAGTFQVELIADFVGREPTARLAIALGKPSLVVWSAVYRDGQSPGLDSLLFRGLFEVEIELIEAMEQLGLPVT